MPSTEQKSLAQSIDHPVRKTAHATEYAILAILLWNTITAYSKIKAADSHKHFRYILALVLTAIYAASDEIHQYFVPGRSCQLTDILIDTSGAATALLLLFLLKR